MNKIEISSFLILTLFVFNICYGQQENNSNLYLQNNRYNNDFFVGPDGSCYLSHKNGMYRLCNSAGDAWCRVADNNLTASVDAKNKSIIYSISTSFQVFKSLDNGNQWIQIQNGLPGEFKPTRILINPFNSSEVFLTSSSGVFRTRDAGFTWQSFKNGPCLGFSISNTKRNVLYFLTPEDLLITNDCGITWSNISNTMPKFLIKTTGRASVSKHPKINSIYTYGYPDHNSVIIANTDKGLYKSLDDGKSWITFNAGYNSSTVISSIFITDKEIFIGGCCRRDNSPSFQTILYSSDSTLTKWEEIPINSPDMGDCIIGILKNASDPGIFIKTTNGRIAYINTKGNVIGLNYGVTPHSVVYAFNIVGKSDKMIQYAIVKNTSYVDIENYGLWRSIDQGISWEKLYITNPDLRAVYWHNPKIFISPVDSLEIWVFNNVNQDSYNIRSYDGGKSWIDIRKYSNIRGIDNPTIGLYGPRFQFDPFNRQIRYLFYGNDLLRYDLETNHSTNLGDHGSSLLISNIDNNIMITNHEITMDGGWTWKPLLSHMEEIEKKAQIANYYSLNPCVFDADYIMLSISNYNAYYQTGKTIFINSYDLGKTWNLLHEFDNELPNIFIDKQDPANITIVKRVQIENWVKEPSSRRKDIIKAILMQSSDGGKSWKELLECIEGQANLSNLFESCLFSYKYNDKRNTYIGSSNGLIHTKDYGKTWDKIGGIHENM
jgi:hypothetical protein